VKPISYFATALAHKVYSSENKGVAQKRAMVRTFFSGTVGVGYKLPPAL